MNKLISLILIVMLLSGCAGQAGSPAAGVADCQTPLDPAADDPVAVVMPSQTDLPEGFKAVACDRLVEDEGFSAMTVTRLYGVSQGWPGHLAVYNNPTQKIYIFVVSPIYTEDRQTFTDLLRTVNQYAAFRMVNAGVKLDSIPQAEAFGQNNQIGEQSAAFGFQGRHNELNLPVAQPVMHDMVLVRRGAVLYGIESIYGTLQKPDLTREKLLQLAEAMDARLKDVLAKHSDLRKVGAAPTPVWSTTTYATADQYAVLTQRFPDLPAEFTPTSEQPTDLITTALGSWMGRAVNFTQYTKAGAADERVQAGIIYPLDAQEQEMFQRLLKDPKLIAGYLIKPLITFKALSPTNDLTQYYTVLPESGELKNVGMVANGFTLTPGELQDTALVLVGRALVVVSVSHPAGTAAPVSAAKYAAWLTGEVEKTQPGP